ncbi:MAG TPA: hypothetical protein ENH20_00910 [Candidatus Pacearchaeota archaeon]|nr:hypothetical protein [Candidatus Pacearchaeota archaeon]
MKRKIGFLSDNHSSREATPYDDFKGYLVRIDIAGGIGLAGELNSCEIHNNGYMFSLKPSIVYQPNGQPRISEKKSLLESNGNAVSIIEIGDSIEDYVSQITERIKSDSQSKKI